MREEIWVNHYAVIVQIHDASTSTIYAETIRSPENVALHVHFVHLFKPSESPGMVEFYIAFWALRQLSIK